MKTKTIALPKLNLLAPSLESTALKLMEEAGELGAAIARYKGYSGIQHDPNKTKADLSREVGAELLDVAQTAITMMFVLEEQYGLDVESVVADHVQKLIGKGYLGF